MQTTGADTLALNMQWLEQQIPTENAGYGQQGGKWACMGQAVKHKTFSDRFWWCVCLFLLRGWTREKANNYHQKARLCQAGGRRNGAKSPTLLQARKSVISTQSSVCSEVAVPPWLVSSYANRRTGHVTLPGICPHTYGQAVNSSGQQEPTPTKANRSLAQVRGM